MTDEPTVTLPLGVLRGQPRRLTEAVEHLANEILGHAADLEAAAEHAKQRPQDYPQTAEIYTIRAADLRKYGWALWLIGKQAQDPRPPTDESDLDNLAELAKLYGLLLPDGWARKPFTPDDLDPETRALLKELKDFDQSRGKA